MAPAMSPVDALTAGEVGYVITGLKDVSRAPRRRHAHHRDRRRDRALAGLQGREADGVRGLFPTDSDQYPELRDALERLKLNDAALFYEPETSQALGFGFRCGFLGLLHMEIVRERLEREFDLDLLVTAPNVAYRVLERDGEWREVHSPADMPRRVRRRRGAVREGVDHRPQGVRRPGDGAEQRPSRQVRPHGVPLARARAPDVRAAARRDRARLLRPAEVAHAGIRELRLRLHRLPARDARSRRRARLRASRSTRCR